MFDFDREVRHHPEPDLVPILDGLVCVIFFLLLSISFVDLSQITLPPAATSTVSGVSDKPPVTPKLKVIRQQGNLLVKLDWQGPTPDHAEFTQKRVLKNQVNHELVANVSKLVGDFKTNFPDEKTMQLTMSEDLSYQELISVMDGIRTKMDDIVLTSYKETE